MHNLASNLHYKTIIRERERERERERSRDLPLTEIFAMSIREAEMRALW